MIGNNVYKKFKRILGNEKFSGKIFDDISQRLAFSVNASSYSMIPKVVVKVENDNDVVSTIKLANKYKLPFTFKGAGTSLSGQCVSNSILIVLGESWTHQKIEKNGEKVTAEVGLTGAQINQRLLFYNKKLGPDPSSLSVAKLGGIAANNAKGNCCGPDQDTYSTLEGLKVILYDGTILDSNNIESCKNFLKSHSFLINQLLSLSNEAKKTKKVREKIEYKYRLRNTVGLTLKALIDFDDPIKILTHLMIGSEGTLGFISEITYRTVDHLPYRATALIFFNNQHEASKSILILKKCNVEAVELMNEGLISAAKSLKKDIEIPEIAKGAVALLIEVSSADKKLLEIKVSEVKESLSKNEYYGQVDFIYDRKEREKLWSLRKGAFAIASYQKLKSNSMIIEDIVFPISELTHAIHDLENLLDKYGYEKIIFGHALFGNLHMIFSIDFEKDKAEENYDNFMKDLYEIVVEKYSGSMKGEHGTGRNVSPFVEKEWGQECFLLMEKIKELFDPMNLINPGVIFNKDKKSYLKDIQKISLVDPLIDDCVECGFCEMVCPSTNLTLSPRQRIFLAREISNKKTNLTKKEVKSLKKSFNYDGIKTCATASICANKCPIGIDTGEYVLSLEKKNGVKSKMAFFLSNHFFMLESGAKILISGYHFLSKVLGHKIIRNIFFHLRKRGIKFLPQPNSFIPTTVSKYKFRPFGLEGEKVVYFPTCVERIMGRNVFSKEEKELPEVLFSILKKAGYCPVLPENLSSFCCGKLFETKGYEDASKNSLSNLNKELLKISRNGIFPIICNITPCTKTLIKGLDARLRIYDTVQFINKFLKKELKFIKNKKEVTIHNTCSSELIGIKEDVLNLASFCSEKVFIPEDINCCGFAGDKGFFFPELNENALSMLKEKIPSHIKDGYSQSIPCEIGLNLHSNCDYRSLLYLINDSTLPIDQ